MQILYVIQNTVFKTSPRDSTRLPSNKKASVQQGQAFPLLSARLIGKHYLVELQQDLFPIGKSGYFFADHIRIETVTDKPLKNRAVWITNTDSEVLTSRNKIKQAIQKLAELNFNTLYPVVWQRGYTLYPSRVAEQVTGAAVLPNSPYLERDMLAELVEAAKANGFRVIPWFEYGLMTPPTSALAQLHPDWLTQQANGDKIKNSMIWLNPVHSDVIAFMANLACELVLKYDIDGIQFDDHFAMPVELGYDSLTKTRYQQEVGQEPPTNHTDASWITWRANKLTNLMRQIAQSVRASKPNGLVSLSPNPYSFSFNKYLVDWQRWVKEALIDELVVQLYRDKLRDFEAELAKPELIAAHDQIPVSVGILSGLRTKSVSFGQMQQQVAAVRQQGFTGVSFFFYETVIHQNLSPVVAVGDRDAAKIRKLFA